jgi:arginine deiminase
MKAGMSVIDDPKNDRAFYKPGHIHFHASEKVLEIEWLLANILNDSNIKNQLIAAVAAIEGCSYQIQEALKKYTPSALASTFLSGVDNQNELIFPPIPNFIFTRDIGIVIKDHLILNMPAKLARKREALFAKYLFHYHPLFKNSSSFVIELSQKDPIALLNEKENDEKVTLEGGDIMMISPQHVIIGVSERTSMSAAIQLTEILFNKALVDKISIVKIPKKRDYMHIDTIFTQVKKDIWVILGNFSKEGLEENQNNQVSQYFKDTQKESVTIWKFERSKQNKPTIINDLEALLDEISREDFGCKNGAQFIYSGNNEFPYNAREQWTDSCNLLALKEGVVLGYDRNDKTVEAFKNKGFEAVHVKDLLLDFEKGIKNPNSIQNTIILMPSGELSRARGGFHCMSMPLERTSI